MTTVTREQALLEMGLGPLWKLRVPVFGSPPLAVAEKQPPRPAQRESSRPIDTVNEVADTYTKSDSSSEWTTLVSAVTDCTACTLCRQRKQAVFGVGDIQADWLFVGEGPGADEDEAGEPFVGQAGKLLDNMLAAIQLKRGADVYIANAVKCRPPNNRTPTDDELAACRSYLIRQIALTKPRLIVALGSSAAKTLLQSAEVKVGALRGRLLEANGIPLIVTYHPSYLLRSPMEKAKAWEDLCFMRRMMHGLKGKTTLEYRAEQP